MNGLVIQFSSIFAGLAMFAFGAVTLWLVIQPGQRMRQLMPSRGALVIVTGALALWSAACFVYGSGSPQAAIADTLRNLAFTAWLTLTFGGMTRGAPSQPIRLILLTLVVINLVASIFASLALLGIALGDLPISTVRLTDTTRVVDMVTASGGLLLVEHFARHRGESVRMPVMVVGGGIAALWAYTLNLHLLGWLSGGEPLTLILLEPLFVLLVLPAFVLVALDTGRDRIRLSRTIAVRTLAILGLALYLVVIAVTGAIARLVGGDYGALAQGVLLTLALGLGGLFFALPRARAWLLVMLSKHFFEHRYDYRAEWMRFTATLEGQEGDNDPPFRRIARALSELAGSPAVLVMTADTDGNYAVNDHWQWPTALEGSDQITTREAFVLQESGRIIDIDHLRRGESRDVGEEVAINLPSWMVADQRIWVLMPLLHLRRMVGIAVLHRPRAPRALDWEDLDVLRISGRQAASHIAEMQSQAELSEARRFDEFNRRFAFIMHDVKNLASQLGLLAANAERHSENPEFRADMIETLKLSVARMNELLHRLSSQGRSGAVTCAVVKVAPLLARIAAEAGRRHPVSTGCDDGLDLSGDAHAVGQILSHLTANAIDASPANTPVLIAASADGDAVRIDVIDHGNGMSREFIRTKLFKPFVSTKDNGFGLGAFEALQLARAMGGRLDVDSREGEGTRFSLWLPRAATASETNQKERAA